MRLLLRADGSHSIGLGHVMRSVALAQAGQEEGLEAVLVTTANRALEDLSHRFDLTVQWLTSQSDREWTRQVDAGDLVVFDGYHFDLEDHYAVRGEAAAVGAVTDHATGSFAADVVSCAVPFNDLSWEFRAPGTALLGARMALLRREFRQELPARQAAGRNRILVTLGGSDAAGITSTVVAEVRAAFPRWDVVVMVGPAAHTVALPDSVSVLRNVQNPAALFQSCDLAVSAAGGTTWELLRCGVPIVLLACADNQVPFAELIAATGAALSAGRADHADVANRLRSCLERVRELPERERLVDRGRHLVDGQGAVRYVQALLAAARNRD